MTNLVPEADTADNVEGQVIENPIDGGIVDEPNTNKKFQRILFRQFSYSDSDDSDDDGEI